MGKKTVKKRIFISNALMVLITLFLFLIINVIIVKVYSESMEQEFKAYIESGQAVDEEELKEIISDFTIRKNGFFALFLADGILCIVGLVIISQLFTKRLVNHIMEPLELLSDGAERIKNNNLTQEIVYSGLSLIHI